MADDKEEVDDIQRFDEASSEPNPTTNNAPSVEPIPSLVTEDDVDTEPGAGLVITEDDDELDTSPTGDIRRHSAILTIGGVIVDDLKSSETTVKTGQADFKELQDEKSEVEDWSGNSGSGEFTSTEPTFPDDANIIKSEEWRTMSRHVFILSESGKPIYSRYGNEDKLVTLFGLMQALVSVVQDGEDSIRAITIGKVRIVFLIKRPLILVGVSRLDQSIPQIQTQLTYFYNQVVSILTAKQLEQIYEKRRNYDLRRLLAGSERLLTSLSDSMETDPSFLLGSVKCLPLGSAIRDVVANTIIQHTTKLRDVVFAILVAQNQLVTLVRMRKCFMHPMDLHIILNLINGSESFKTGENWTPICLPRFDSSGFVHAHVSYLADDCEACLVLLTVDRDSFFVLSEAKQKIVDRLRTTNSLDALNLAMKSNWPCNTNVGIPQIRHFIYKSKQIAQFAMPTLSLPYALDEDCVVGTASGERNNFARLFRAYGKIHARLHSHSRPLRLLYATADKENFMGWMTSTFELYVTFEPLTKKAVAIAGVEKLLKWVKKEEERLFITNSPTF